MEPFEARVGDLDAYLAALRVWRAGAVSLDTSEDASTVQLMLLRAASLRELSVVTTWREGGRVLFWSRVGRTESSARVGSLDPLLSVWRRLARRSIAGTRSP